VSEGRDNGFTLIETLVAMSVLAISLTVIFQLFSGGLKSSRLSQEYDRGIFHAREKMEEVLLSEELSEGVLEGEFEDSFGWKTEIFRVESAEQEEITLPFDTFRITVEVMWGEEERERNFEISTIKIKKKLRK
jgi:general secretion pathway protein I